jgi:hypothetical protein
LLLSFDPHSYFRNLRQQAAVTSHLAQDQRRDAADDHRELRRAALHLNDLQGRRGYFHCSVI